MVDSYTPERAESSPPYEAYAAIMGAYVGGLGFAGFAARMLDRDPACQTPLDFAVLSVIVRFFS